MANSHSEEAKNLLKELKDNGITDLDGLVKKITQDKAAAAKARLLLCNHNYCVVVREK